MLPIEFTHAGIVPRSNFLGAQPQSMVEKSLELDFGIAQYIRVGRPSRLIFLKKFGKNTFLVFGGEIDHLDVDADPSGDAHDINQILPRIAVFSGVVILPVRHEQADDIRCV